MKKGLVSRMANREARLWALWDRRLAEWEADDNRRTRQNLHRIKGRFGLEYDCNDLLIKVNIQSPKINKKKPAKRLNCTADVV